MIPLSLSEIKTIASIYSNQQLQHTDIGSNHGVSWSIKQNPLSKGNYKTPFILRRVAATVG
jgi:hypothetical protein